MCEKFGNFTHSFQIIPRRRMEEFFTHVIIESFSHCNEFVNNVRMDGY